MKSILLNDSIFKWIKKWPLGAVGSCCCPVGPGPEFLFDIPDHNVRNHGDEAGQLRCFHAVSYRRPSSAVTHVDCFELTNIGDWLLSSNKLWLRVPEPDASVWSVKCLTCLPACHIKFFTVNCRSIVGTHLAILFAVPEWIKDLWFCKSSSFRFYVKESNSVVMMCGVLHSVWWCVISVPFYFLQLFRGYEYYIRS